MVDECIVQRPTGTPDPLTGVTEKVTVYEGRCKVGGDRPYENQQNAGGSFGSVQRYTVHVPALSGPYDDGDLVTVTASPLQPHLVGRTARMAGRDERSLQTAQRIFVDFRS